MAVRLIELERGPQHPSFAMELGNLSEDELNSGHLQDAFTDASRAVAAVDDAAARGEISPRSHLVGFVHQELGSVLLRLGRATEAREHFAGVVEVYRVAYGADSRDVAYTDAYLGEALRVLGRLDEAERALAGAR